VLFAELEHVHRADEVMLDELTGACFAIDAGEDARVGSGVDYEVDSRDGFEIAGRSEVTVVKFYSEGFEFGPVGFAAWADEIIEADQRVVLAGLYERPGEGAADKAADAGDKYFHTVWSRVEKAASVKRIARQTSDLGSCYPACELSAPYVRGSALLLL
jgi:hypothetical protein